VVYFLVRKRDSFTQNAELCQGACFTAFVRHPPLGEQGGSALHPRPAGPREQQDDGGLHLHHPGGLGKGAEPAGALGFLKKNQLFLPGGIDWQTIID
jgi:hypothetical protein